MISGLFATLVSLLSPSQKPAPVAPAPAPARGYHNSSLTGWMLHAEKHIPGLEQMTIVAGYAAKSTNLSELPRMLDYMVVQMRFLRTEEQWLKAACKLLQTDHHYRTLIAAVSHDYPTDYTQAGYDHVLKHADIVKLLNPELAINALGSAMAALAPASEVASVHTVKLQALIESLKALQTSINMGIDPGHRELDKVQARPHNHFTPT